jgi:DNA repair photolyase
LEEHYKDIKRISGEGIYVSVQVNPIVPGVTSHADIIKLFKRLSQAGADHVILKFVEAGYAWANTMVDRIEAKFGERGKKFGELFNQNIGGERTIDEDYRMRAHKLYGTYARRYGLTYSVCYEYRYERDEDGKIVNKRGISIGPEVTTSDQCHGHRVPCYTRESLDDRFREVTACPPSGCLYCASGNEGRARCGDALAGSASALKLKDMRNPIGG